MKTAGYPIASWQLAVFVLLSVFPISAAYAEGLAEVDPLVVTPFVPPAPVVPKEMPDIAVEDSVAARMENQRQLHIVRAEPSDLQDLTIIRQELAREAEAAAVEPENRAFEAPETNHKSITFGATVIDREISHVTWTDATGERREALCGFDISLLEGVPAFGSGGTTYSLMLMHGQHVSSRDGGYAAKAFPELRVKPGEILLPASENGAEVPEDLITIGTLICLERERLVQFQRARNERQEAERKWREANPEPPRDETIWLRPHSGSRYLDGTESSNTTGKATDK